MKIKKTCLIIVDGMGINPQEEGNAVNQANTPNLDQLLSTCPHSTLTTHGKAVGLPEGQMGNSEVGHINIGAGRVVKQSLVRIADDLTSQYLSANENFQTWRSGLQESTTIHLVGLLSDGGVHSHIDHLIKLVKITNQIKDLPIKLHIITDGRDTSPNGAENYLQELLEAIENEDNVSIATLGGRYFAMDRDNRWERTHKAFKVMVEGNENTAQTPLEYIRECYKSDTTDEYISPASFNDYQGIKEEDAVIFFNFRADRMRQIVRALSRPDFEEFSRPKYFRKSQVLTMTEYDKEFDIGCLFPPQTIENHIGQLVADAGANQLRAAETEKYPHVTYFFNGGVEVQLQGEERILVPSPQEVATYDEKPEMSAVELTEKVITALGTGNFSFCVLNYANCDMVGHTGVLDAAVKAVETVDDCLGRLLEFLRNDGWNALIIADHGNAEQMINYSDGSVHTAHTLYPVPAILVSSEKETSISLKEGALCDVAPTLLDLMGLSKHEDMKGNSLLVK